ncbi:MAG: tryptophan--tRNA ligase, partial [Fuerstiella sp.]|nr:tryptophan--tRNA ligase [Fuerstiella sp.]
LEQRPDDVEDILLQGAKQARQKARDVLERVRTACGLKSLPPEL